MLDAVDTLKDELGSSGDIADSHTSPMVFEMAVERTIVRADHDFAMMLPTQESWIEGCDIPESTGGAFVPLP